MFLRLYLRTREDRHGLRDIAIIYRNNNQEAYFSTGRKIQEDYWDAKNQCAKPNYGDASHTLNMILRKMLGEAEEKMNKFFLSNNRYPSTAEMKLLMNNKSSDKSFFGLFDEFMHHRKSSVTNGTYRNYKKVKDRFEKYQEHTGMPFTFQSINHSFYTKFTGYLTKEYESQVNTIGSYIRILKTFLHWAQLHHEVQLDPVVLSGLHVANEQNWYVSLSKEEIDILEKLDFGEHKPLLNNTRDTAVLQCSLGCRYGDLQKTMTENIVLEGGVYFFKIKTRKNKKLIQVPLSRRAVAILEKHKGIPPSAWIPTNTDFNFYIKEVCKLAKFYEKVQVVRGSGDNRKEETYQKWQLVTSHTMRRTFINTMLADGITVHVVAAMTGQTIPTIQRYMHANTADIQKAITTWDRPAPESKESGAPRRPE